jgi:hypothetical protein
MVLLAQLDPLVLREERLEPQVISELPERLALERLALQGLLALKEPRVLMVLLALERQELLDHKALLVLEEFLQQMSRYSQLTELGPSLLALNRFMLLLSEVAVEAVADANLQAELLLLEAAAAVERHILNEFLMLALLEIL